MLGTQGPSGSWTLFVLFWGKHRSAWLGWGDVWQTSLSHSVTWPAQVGDNRGLRQSKAALEAMEGLMSHGGPRERGWGGAGVIEDLDSPTMIPQALTNPISFFRATPPPPEPASAWGLVSELLPPGWFFAGLFRCRAPFSIFLRRVRISTS